MSVAGNNYQSKAYTCFVLCIQVDLQSVCSPRVKTLSLDVTLPESVQNSFDFVAQTVPAEEGKCMKGYCSSRWGDAKQARVACGGTLVNSFRRVRGTFFQAGRGEHVQVGRGEHFQVGRGEHFQVGRGEQFQVGRGEHV